LILNHYCQSKWANHSKQKLRVLQDHYNFPIKSIFLDHRRMICLDFSFPQWKDWWQVKIEELGETRTATKKTVKCSIFAESLKFWVFEPLTENMLETVEFFRASASSVVEQRIEKLNISPLCWYLWLKHFGRLNWTALAWIWFFPEGNVDGRLTKNWSKFWNLVDIKQTRKFIGVLFQSWS